MNQQPIQIAIIGCGRIANIAHLPALSALPNAKIKYVCDLIEEKANAAKNTFSVPYAITDYKTALADAEVDAVYVLTPNAAHYTITMDALAAGKHVFCEKPVAVNYALSKEMANAASRAKKLLHIGVCNRYNCAVEQLAQRNAAKEFGKLYHVYCSFRSFRSIPGLGGAFTDRSQSGGGVLIDWGIHFLDLILYVLGGAKLQSVTCDTYSEMAKDMREYRYLSMWAEDTKNLNGTNDVEDFVTGYIRTDRASISFNGAWAQNIGTEEMFVDFLGDKGGARLRYGSDYSLYTTENGILTEKKPLIKINNHYEAEDAAFLEAIRTNAHTKNEITEILESMKLLDGLYTSAKQHREIVF